MNTEELKESAVSYALANGILHGEILNDKQYQTHMPISLFPFVVCDCDVVNGSCRRVAMRTVWF